MSAKISTTDALRALEGEDAAALRPMLRALESAEAALDGAVVARLVALLDHPSKEVRRLAAGGLAVAAVEVEHARTLETLLAKSESRVRWGATFALARAGATSPAVFRTALDALSQEDGDVRWAAAEIVCTMARERPALRASIVALASDGSAPARKMAVYCLRDGGERQARAFEGALADGDATVRLAALSALPRCTDIAEPILRQVAEMMQHDPAVGVRRAAAAVLGRIMGESLTARSALAEAARCGDDADTARVAEAALRRYEEAKAH